MDSPELLSTAFADLHKELLDDVEGLDHEALFWQPAPAINHIGFLLWHIIRDEDTVVCQSLLDRPELWVSGGWAAKFEFEGLGSVEQGTGFNSELLPRFRYEMPELLSYAWDVWAQTSDALSGLDSARLDEDLAWSTEWKLANLLTTGCLSHGWVHLGEIRQLRGLRGWKFRE